jgi:hypothetical protein
MLSPGSEPVIGERDPCGLRERQQHEQPRGGGASATSIDPEVLLGG